MYQWKYAQFNVILLCYLLWNFSQFLLSDFCLSLVQIIIWSKICMVLFFLTVLDNVEALFYAHNLDIFGLVQEYTTSSNWNIGTRIGIYELANISWKAILFPPVNIHYLKLFGKNDSILISENLDLQIL